MLQLWEQEIAEKAYQRTLKRMSVNSVPISLKRIISSTAHYTVQGSFTTCALLSPHRFFGGTEYIGSGTTKRNPLDSNIPERASAIALFRAVRNVLTNGKCP